MTQLLSVLIADTDDDRRRELGLALYEGGIEVVNAVNAEEALRFTAGLDPSPGGDPLRSRGYFTGGPLLEVGRNRSRPAAVSGSVGEDVTDHPVVDGGEFHFLAADDLEPARFLLKVRLLLLAREIGAEIGEIPRHPLRRSHPNRRRRSAARARTGRDHGSCAFERRTGRRDLAFGRQGHPGLLGQLKGRKAFNRIAGLHQGAFVLDLVAAIVESAIDVDLGVLVSDAIEERLQLEDLFARLPSLNARSTSRWATTSLPSNSVPSNARS